MTTTEGLHKLLERVDGIDIDTFNKDEAVSLKILNAWRRMPDFCCITLRSDYDFVWDITWKFSDDPVHVSHSTETSYENLREAVLESFIRATDMLIERRKKGLELRIKELDSIDSTRTRLENIEEMQDVIDEVSEEVRLLAVIHAEKRPAATMLIEEVAEFILAVRGKHEHPIEVELAQIASVAINMICQIRLGQEEHVKNI